MIDLVSLAKAKLQLRIEGTERDADIAMKIAQASAIVMQYYKKTAVPDEWYGVSSSPATITVPADIEAATLLVLGELYENREASIANVLSDSVKALIPRDPTLA